MSAHKDRKKYDIYVLSTHYYGEYCKSYKNNVNDTKKAAQKSCAIKTAWAHYYKNFRCDCFAISMRTKMA